MNSSSYYPDLLHVLKMNFNDSELEQLAYELRVDYEDLEGKTKGKKALELVKHLDRRNRISELINLVYLHRPHLRLTPLAARKKVVRSYRRKPANKPKPNFLSSLFDDLMSWLDDAA